MHRIHRSTAFILCFLILPLLVGERALAQAGNSGLAFLKLGVSGRGISMGDALTTIADGAAATYYNPAGIVNACTSCNPTQLLFTHKEWIQDTRTEFLGAAIRIGDQQSLGISVNTTYTSDIEIRTRPGPPEGTFTSRDFSLGLSYARALSGDLRIGATVKYLYEKILVDEAAGFGVDAGLQYATPVEGLLAGVMLANIGSMNGFRSSSITLPATLKLGPAYSLPLEDLHLVATVVAEFERIFPEHRSYANAGGELFFNQIVGLRAGYQFGSEGRGFSAGVGLRYGMILLDYAYAPISQGLGNAHTITVAVNF